MKRILLVLIGLSGGCFFQGCNLLFEERVFGETDTGGVTDTVDTETVDTDTVDTETVDTETVDTETVDTDTVDTDTVDTDTADTDTVDTETVDTETVDTETETPQFVDCDGGKLDIATNLCWQDPPFSPAMTYEDAEYNCGVNVGGAHNNWSLPSIDELITLLRGCQDGTITGDHLSRSLCEMASINYSDDDVLSCGSCDWYSGPGENGHYRDPALDGDGNAYWSYTTPGPYPNNPWLVDFLYGTVVNTDADLLYYTRCVRVGP
jgi:hypothetical protein